MKSALIVYNEDSGKGKFAKKLKYIEKELASSFEKMLFLSPKNKEEASLIYKNKAPLYDVLIIVGGDGTLNFAINEIMDLEKKPIIGYINSGTLGDAGKNFGIKRNLKKSLKIIKDGNIKHIDICEAYNNKDHMYFLYTLCTGTYSSLAYTVKRKKKKVASYFSYYFASIKEMFKKNNVNLSYKVNDSKITSSTPFVLLMNGEWMGGFKLNKKSNMSDGLIEAYFPKPSFLNGILRFVPFKKEKALQINEISFVLEDKNLYWCFDGEKGLQGDISIRVIKNALSFYSK